MIVTDRHRVEYIVGLAKNQRLTGLADDLLDGAEERWKRTGEKQRNFKWIEYGASTWDRSRQVIAKAEHSDKGRNPAGC